MPACKGEPQAFQRLLELAQVAAFHSTRNAWYNSFSSVDNRDLNHGSKVSVHGSTKKVIFVGRMQRLEELWQETSCS